MLAEELALPICTVIVILKRKEMGKRIIWGREEVYRCVPMESNVCLRDSIYLEHLSSSHTSSFLHVFQWLKHGARASGFNSASMKAQKHVPRPQKEVQSSVLLMP